MGHRAVHRGGVVSAGGHVRRVRGQQGDGADDAGSHVFRRAGRLPGRSARAHGAPAEADRPDQAALPGEKGFGVRPQVPEKVV